ncbi:YqjF family protein [Haloferax sp. YSSS75]|uniref:YqjF family protein n=1 Tax=Haloferax sp. YSSS75 TaxID=3388564 RepID=UPI00398C9DD9
MDLLSMRWRHTLFAHWPVDPDVVQAHLPDRLTVATYDGRAWLGVVSFDMVDIRPRGSPVGLSFPEVNLRTYVEPASGGERGVYFFTLDAADRLGVTTARLGFRLPYHYATMAVRERDGAIDYQSYRPASRDAPAAHFDATYRPVGDPSPPELGSLTEFLTENYRFYTDEWPIVVGVIDHDPWPIQDADVEIRANTMFEACGFDHPGGDPLVHYAREIDVTAEPPAILH